MFDPGICHYYFLLTSRTSAFARFGYSATRLCKQQKPEVPNVSCQCVLGLLSVLLEKNNNFFLLFFIFSEQDFCMFLSHFEKKIDKKKKLTFPLITEIFKKRMYILTRNIGRGITRLSIKCCFFNLFCLNFFWFIIF